jgi:uncharacterized protein YjiS (DUF1127 family)
MSTMPLTAVRSDGAVEPSHLQRLLAAVSRRFFASHERLVIRDHLRELRDLDEFMLRDIGATSDQIYRIHRMRNGDRPTLAVG